MRFNLIPIIWIVFASSLGANQCNNHFCPAYETDSLNVHIVPHSHDDVGWLKTVDQYYYGRRNIVQNAAVNLILSSVVEELSKNRTRKFIYVETAFFKKWYERQSIRVQMQVGNLVRDGQLEFISGAWSMNDEATTHYQSIIDQFAWGLKYLNETFGECARPHIGWQIDPFGHSRQFAWILSEMDFTALFLGRIDYQDKETRLFAKRMETLWQTSANSQKLRNQLWTSVLYNTYSPPKGFCFDILCANEAIVDDRNSPEFNLDSKIDMFLDFVHNQSKRYRTNHVIVTMGEDFNYQDARIWYDNLDLLINELNYRKRTKDLKVNAFYSTPSCYAAAVQESARLNRIEFPSKNDDYFPYASDPHAFWTGYFTSRPALKRYERLANNYLQICKQLYVLANVNRTFLSNINVMREAMGIMQHHDAVSGTEKQHVANDYARLLAIGFDRCTAVIEESFRRWNLTAHRIDSSLLFNISDTTRNTSEDFTIIVYNPLSRFVYRYPVRVPVMNRRFTIDDRNVTIDYQLVPVAKSVRNIPGRASNWTHELVFQIADLAPLSYRKFRVRSEPITKKTVTKRSWLRKRCISNEFVGTHDLGLVIDKMTGQLTKLMYKGQLSNFTQTFAQYRGMRGNNRSFLRRASGAYIFRPNGTAQTIASPNSIRYRVVRGPIVTEIHQEISANISQVIKLYANESQIEFNWLVGPIDISDGIGKEIVSKFCTNIENNGAFYTDSNGKEMLKRVRNFRPDWGVILVEKQAGNYYPITTRISIEQDKIAATAAAGTAAPKRMTVVVDRAEGGSSLQDGCIELMVHRRLLHDDGFGVAEPLNETAFNTGLVVRGSHWVLFANDHNELEQEKFLQQEKVLSPWIFLTDTEPSDRIATVSSPKSLIPWSENVQILSLEPWSENRLLIRLEHLFERHESEKWSKNVTVQLNATLFAAYDIRIENMAETTLDGNKIIRNFSNSHEIVIEPAAIRTFLLTV